MSAREISLAVRRMLYETGVELEAAQAVKRFEGWTLSDEAARHRLMQTLGESSPRHFSAEWLPIVIRIAVFHGGDDLVASILDEARYAGRRARDREEPLELERRGPVRARREPVRRVAGG